MAMGHLQSPIIKGHMVCRHEPARGWNEALAPNVGWWLNSKLFIQKEAESTKTPTRCGGQSWGQEPAGQGAKNH